MMLMLRPDGALKEVEKVEAINEIRFPYNGSIRRVIEKCAPKSQPNGVCILYVDGDKIARQHNELVVGNLKAETVRQILQKLLKDGSFDFTSLNFQPWAEDMRETIFDFGASLPYTNEFVQRYCDTGLYDMGWEMNPYRKAESSMEILRKGDEDSKFDDDLTVEEINQMLDEVEV